MRFMIQVRANTNSGAGSLPEDDHAASMASWHEELARAGVLLDASGLRPSRVRCRGLGVGHGPGTPGR